VTPYRTAAEPEPLPRVKLAGDVLQVSDENLGECERALEAILKNMRTLLDWASRYPVFVEFAGYRFVLGSAEELAVALECKMAEHRGRQTPKT
jgi:hypothetical protein